MSFHKMQLVSTCQCLPKLSKKSGTVHIRALNWVLKGQHGGRGQRTYFVRGLKPVGLCSFTCILLRIYAVSVSVCLSLSLSLKHTLHQAKSPRRILEEPAEAKSNVRYSWVEGQLKGTDLGISGGSGRVNSCMNNRQNCSSHQAALTPESLGPLH